VIPKNNNHKNVKYTFGYPPTCTTDGAGDGSYCDDCGTVIVAQQVIPTSGHIYDAQYTIDKPATESESGYKSRHCTAGCDAFTDCVELPAFSSITMKNTDGGIQLSWKPYPCTYAYYYIYRAEAGTSTSAATANGMQYITTTTDTTYLDTTVKLGTTYLYLFVVKDENSQTNATSRTANIIVSGACVHIYDNACDTTCNSCGNIRTISHTYKTTTTQATTSKNGSIIKKCSVCGKVASTTTINYAKTFTLSTTSYTYNGKVQTPSVTVRDSAGTTISASHYTVSYASDRKNVGTYNVTVTMKGNFTGKKTLTFKILPQTPTVTAAGTATGNKVTWKPVTGAKGYDVYARYYKNGAWSGWTKLGKTTATSYTHTNAAYGYYYQYTVIAYNGALRSSFKASGNAIRLAQPTVTAVGNSAGVKVTWNKVSGAKSYNVYARYYKNGAWSGWVKMGNTTATYYAHTKAAYGYYYQYTVIAYNGTSQSTFKASGSAIRLAQPAVVATGATAGNKVTWNKISGAKKYNVYVRYYKNGAWTGWSMVSSTTALSYTHTNAAYGYYCQYTVIAFNGANQSAFKASGTVMRLAQPKVTTVKSGVAFKSTWGKAAGAKGYNVCRQQYDSKTKTWSKWVKLASVTTLSYTDKTAKAGIYYRYTVTAYNGANLSSYAAGNNVKR